MSLVGGLEHFLFFHMLGMSSSQLTKSIIFQRGGSINHQPEVVHGCYMGEWMYIASVYLFVTDVYQGAEVGMGS